LLEDLIAVGFSLTSPSTIRNHGTSSNRRQEAEEEVVEGQGYAKLQFHRTHHPPDRTQPHSAARTEHHIERNRQHEYALTRYILTVKDKAQHNVLLDKATNDKLQKDVQSYRLVTVAVLVDRLKINGSLARKCLADLEEKGVIKQVVNHHACKIYSE
jgi:small subunit ribosomal protein S25e